MELLKFASNYKHLLLSGGVWGRHFVNKTAVNVRYLSMLSGAETRRLSTNPMEY